MKHWLNPQIVDKLLNHDMKDFSTLGNIISQKG
nr:MAG TPA: integrase protein [Caudoviricetes sp.]